MIKVLINDSGQRHQKIIEKSLEKEGYTILKEKISESNIRQILQKLRPTVLLPITIEDFKLFSKIKKDILKLGTKILIADYNTWFQYYDKYLCLNLVSKANIPYPKSVRIFSSQEIKDAIKKYKLNFPIVIKYPQEGGSRFVKFAYSLSQAIDIINEFTKNGANIKSIGVLVQEYIEGQSCGYFALAIDGNIIAEFGHIRTRENPPWGGVSCVCESFYSEKMFNYGRKLINIKKYTGVCMIEFKKTKDEEFYWIETNPKFWGSILLPIVCGVNFPVLYVKLALGENITPKLGNSFKKLKIQYLLCDIKRAIKYRKLDIIKVIIDFINPKVKKDIFYLGVKDYFLFYINKIFKS